VLALAAVPGIAGLSQAHRSKVRQPLTRKADMSKRNAFKNQSMTESTRARIAAATVRFKARRGQGVIVPGPLIVTAAHVLSAAHELIDWTNAEPVFEEVAVGDRTVAAEVRAIEPIADIAVLSRPDDQTAYESAEAFDAVIAPIRPVPICTTDFVLFESVPVYIFTHTGRWVIAQATQSSANAPNLFLRASEHIALGTSGSPVVTPGGELIGVASTAGGREGAPMTDITVPRLHLTAPGWLVGPMRDPEWPPMTDVTVPRRSLTAPGPLVGLMRAPGRAIRKARTAIARWRRREATDEGGEAQ
jgi:S1-C subfamily serine protease